MGVERDVDWKQRKWRFNSHQTSNAVEVYVTSPRENGMWEKRTEFQGTPGFMDEMMTRILVSFLLLWIRQPLKTQHSRGSCLTCNSSFIAHPFGRVKVKTEVACHITSLVKNRRINSPLPDCLLLTSFLSYLGCCLGSRATHNRLVGEDRGRWRSPQVNIMETWGGSISLEEGTGDNVICHEMTLWVQCQGGFGYIVSHWGHGLWFEVNEAFSLGSKA